MRKVEFRVTVLLGLVALCAGIVSAQEMKAPEPEVPEIFTLTGEFVRVAYNNEGYVTLGYRIANDSVAEDWMLLDVGLTMRGKTKPQTLKRAAFSLMLPDGSTIDLATQKEFADAGSLPALNMRANTVRDSINYFPVEANQPCSIGFFSDPATRGRSLSFDEVSLSRQRACLGRIFFNVPGKIQTGQYYLVVTFENSIIQVPFRIFTKAEEKEFRKKWKDFKKQHDATYKQ